MIAGGLAGAIALHCIDVYDMSFLGLHDRISRAGITASLFVCGESVLPMSPIRVALSTFVLADAWPIRRGYNLLGWEGKNTVAGKLRTLRLVRGNHERSTPSIPSLLHRLVFLSRAPRCDHLQAIVLHRLWYA
jgi:hypothetical protein